MALKDKLPAFEKGSPSLGDQLRELLAVVVEICEAIEADPAPEQPASETPAEAPEAPAEDVKEVEAPVVEKPASKPATRASAK
jgi:hypothetical protein